MNPPDLVHLTYELKALRYSKEGVRRASVRDARAFGSWVPGTLGRLFQTEDHREGGARFLKKRAPQFKGR